MIGLDGGLGGGFALVGYLSLLCVGLYGIYGVVTGLVRRSISRFGRVE